MKRKQMKSQQLRNVAKALLLVVLVAAKVVYEAGHDHNLGQVEQGVVHEDPLLVQVDELVGVLLRDFVPAQCSNLVGGTGGGWKKRNGRSIPSISYTTTLLSIAKHFIKQNRSALL